MVSDPINLAGGLLVMAVLAALGCLIIQFTSRDPRQATEQFRLFGTALLVRFGLAVFIYAVGFISVLKDEDGMAWQTGASLAEQWSRNGVGLIQVPIEMLKAYDGHHMGFPYMLAGFFSVTGLVGRMPAAALNCFFGALAVLLVYRLTSCLFSHWVATRAAWMTCLFPSMIIWSAQTIKEPVVILLELCCVYSFIRIRQARMQPRHIAICVVAILLVAPFRFYVVYLLIAAILLSFLPAMVAGRMTTPVLVVAVVAPIVIGSGILARQQAIAEKYDLKRIQNMREFGSKTTGSGVNSGIDVTTPHGLTAGIAVGAAHLLLAPFPWQLRGSVRMMMTLPELLYWWWLVSAALLPGMKYALSKRFADVMPLMTLIFGFGLLYSLTFYNVGLVYRQRAQLLPYLLIFAAVGLERREMQKLARREAYFRARLQIGARS